MVGALTQSGGKGVSAGEGSGRIYRPVEQSPGRLSIGNGSSLRAEKVGLLLKENGPLKNEEF